MNKEKLSEEDILFIQDMCRRSFSGDRELAQECFLYVLEKIKENDSRRIKAYRGESSFRTFLYSITTKLIIDFRRSVFGYRVLPKYYWDFDEINRYIFKLFFYHNADSRWIENAIQAEYRITAEEAQRRVREVEERIIRSRIKLGSREQQAVSLGREIDSLYTVDKESNPEVSIISAELRVKRERIVTALKEEVQKLKAEDALILQLYFEHGLTARQIASAIPGLKEKSIYKRVKRTLKELRKNLKKRGITEEDISEILDDLP
jgi:RNA polymerase sigma factor (sigma-70 family)